LASRLLGWTTVCAVEYDAFCRERLFARQRDGVLETFPIWDDVRTFNGRPWRGTVDLVSGGFPCQAFSTAARGRNNAPDLWPEMLRIVREVQPRFVFGENVQKYPIERAAQHLTEAGYEARFMQLSAADLGAPIRRARWWVAGFAHDQGEPVGAEHAKMAELPCARPSVWDKLPGDGIRVSNGLASRVGRLRAAGNGQVPAVAAAAWRLLSEGWPQ